MDRMVQAEADARLIDLVGIVSRAGAVHNSCKSRNSPSRFRMFPGNSERLSIKLQEL